MELHSNFLCFLIAKANGPPGGNASGCVQQVPSLANAQNVEKNLRRLREKDERQKTLGEFKENGEEQRHTLPAWADWGLMGGFSSQSELEVLVSASAWGRGLKRANSVILLVHLEMGCAS